MFRPSLLKHALPIAAILVVAVPDALASDLPPWTDPGDLPLPKGVVSVITKVDDAPILVGPNASSARHGVVGTGQPLPFFGLRRGPGCTGRWVSVGPLAWICEDQVQFAGTPWLPPDEVSYQASSDGLPFRYYFVGQSGALAYYDIDSVDQASPDQELERGFAVTIAEQRQAYGETYGRSRHGLWIAMRELSAVRAPTFHGQAIEDGRMDFAWVVNPKAVMFSKPAATARTKTKLARFQRFTVLDSSTAAKKTFHRVGDEQWLDAADVRQPSIAAPPSSVAPNERWIDVELSTQTLVAYEGTRPVYATLVSTGRGAQGSEFATPKGEHRIWVKLVRSDMDNLEDEEANNYYSLEDVPYVQYFSKGVGLHAAFWHSGFGHVRSHGCVNLPPIDAKWLFSFTGPRLPSGWQATFPTDLEQGTVVRVR